MLPASLLPLLLHAGPSLPAPHAPVLLQEEAAVATGAVPSRPSYDYLELGYDRADFDGLADLTEDRIQLTGSFEFSEHGFALLVLEHGDGEVDGAPPATDPVLDRRTTHLSAGIGGRFSLASGLDAYGAVRMATNQVENEVAEDEDYETLHLRLGLRYLVMERLELAAYFEHANAFGVESAPDVNTVQLLGRMYLLEDFSLGITWQQDDAAGSDRDARTLGVRLGYFF